LVIEVAVINIVHCEWSVSHAWIPTEYSYWSMVPIRCQSMPVVTYVMWLSEPTDTKIDLKFRAVYPCLLITCLCHGQF